MRKMWIILFAVFLLTGVVAQSKPAQATTVVQIVEYKMAYADTLASATAAANKTRLDADAALYQKTKEAEGLKVTGEATRKFNAALAENLNVELKKRELDNEAARISKWDGRYVPNNMYGPIPVNTRGGVQGE